MSLDLEWLRSRDCVFYIDVDSNGTPYDIIGRKTLSPASMIYTPGLNGRLQAKYATPTASKIDIANGSDIYQGTDNFTFCFWMKRSQAISSTEIIVEHKTETSFAVYMTTANVILGKFAGVGACITGTTTITTGEPYFVAVKRSSTTDTRLYLNCEQEGSTYATNWNWANPSSDFRLGNYEILASALGFRGWITDAMLFDGVALSDTELKHIMRETIPG